MSVDFAQFSGLAPGEHTYDMSTLRGTSLDDLTVEGTATFYRGGFAYEAQFRIPVRVNDGDPGRLTVDWPAPYGAYVDHEDGHVRMTMSRFRRRRLRGVYWEKYYPAPTIHTNLIGVVTAVGEALEDKLPSVETIKERLDDARQRANAEHIEELDELLGEVERLRMLVETARKYVVETGSGEDVVDAQDAIRRVSGVIRNILYAISITYDVLHMQMPVVAQMVDKTHPLYEYGDYARQTLAKNPSVPEAVLIRLLADDSAETVRSARYNSEARAQKGTASDRLKLALRLVEAGNYQGDPDGLVETVDTVLADI